MKRFKKWQNLSLTLEDSSFQREEQQKQDKYSTPL